MAVSEEVSEALRLFVSNANWSVLHPRDDDRFNDALILAHRRRERITPSDLEHVLRTHGAPVAEDVMFKLVVRWEQGIDLLERYDGKP